VTRIPGTERHPATPVDEPRRAVGRYAALEGYRGLAALLIVVFHVYQYMRSGPTAAYPYVGTWRNTLLVGLDSTVGLFFVLSAFLLTLPYARAGLTGNQPVAARAFLFRRSVRIVPLYLVAVLVVWASRNPALPGDWRDLVEHLTFTQVFDDKRIFYTIGPAWSLAVEVHFYLLLALLGPVVCRRCHAIATRAGRIRTLWGVVTGLAAVGILWKLIAWYVLGARTDAWSVWFGLPAKIDIFAVGMALAVVVASREQSEPMSRSARRVLAGSGGAVVVAAFATNSTTQLSHLFFHTVAAVGFGLVIAASAFVPGQRSSRVLGSPVPALLGLISYSMYMWHEPLMLLLAHHGLFPIAGSPNAFPVGVLILVTATAVVGWLSYWVIEYPTGKLRRSRDESGSLREYYHRREYLTRR
jgi:peptidoglycan/LPS O-acetylase OafA/YrhL